MSSLAQARALLEKQDALAVAVLEATRKGHLRWNIQFRPRLPPLLWTTLGEGRVSISEGPGAMPLVLSDKRGRHVISIRHAGNRELYQLAYAQTTEEGTEADDVIAEAMAFLETLDGPQQSGEPLG
jgi:hypothetical protein